MILYAKFKEIFDSIKDGESEIELYFNNRSHSYMIIKYSDHVSFQRCGYLQEQSGEIRFETLDDLYNAQTIDNIILKNEWGNIYDIVFNATYSVLKNIIWRGSSKPRKIAMRQHYQRSGTEEREVTGCGIFSPRSLDLKEVFQKVLDKYFDGKKDRNTLQILGG